MFYVLTAKMADSKSKATKQCHVTCRSQLNRALRARNAKHLSIILLLHTCSYRILLEYYHFHGLETRKVQMVFDLFEDQRREGMFPMFQNIHLERKNPNSRAALSKPILVLNSIDFYVHIGILRCSLDT